VLDVELIHVRIVGRSKDKTDQAQQLIQAIKVERYLQKSRFIHDISSLGWQSCAYDIHPYVDINNMFVSLHVKQCF
jgi:hypothetical protein